MSACVLIRIASDLTLTRATNNNYADTLTKTLALFKRRILEGLPYYLANIITIIMLLMRRFPGRLKFYESQA